MEILVSEFPITEESVYESSHKKTCMQRDPGRERKAHVHTHISLICTEMYEGPSCIFIHIHVVSLSSQVGI